MNQTPEQTALKINHQAAADIIREFDFIKVLEYMTSVNWQYLGKPVDMDAIVSNARMCLRECVNDYEKTGQPYGNVGTGGFTATYFPWGLSLTFNLEYKRNY